jgi:hypothetical protein
MLTKDIVLEEIIKDAKPVVTRNHPVYAVESHGTYDLSKVKLPELYDDGRVIGNENYIQVK